MCTGIPSLYVTDVAATDFVEECVQKFETVRIFDVITLSFFPLPLPFILFY